MNKKYLVTLTDEERQRLQTLVGQGRAAARRITRAWILLKADGADGPGWPDEQIRQTFTVGLDGDQEAQLIALACSKPPPGRRRWTLRLLTSKFVELGYAEHVSPETVRQMLKKTS
jgi:hypothetical protein